MSANSVRKGDFKGWLQVCDHPGGAMAWNWLPMMNLHYAAAPLFPAVAIGLYDEPNKPLAIRTPYWVMNNLVAPVIALVMKEQHLGVPIALSLTAEHDCWLPPEQPDHLALMLHAKDPETLNGYFTDLSAATKWSEA